MSQEQLGRRQLSLHAPCPAHSAKGSDQPDALPDIDVEQKLGAFEACIERRRSVIELAEGAGLREEVLYLLPQEALRCTEAFKLAYGCSKAEDLPVGRVPDGGQAATFLQIAREERGRYERKSAIPNHRFVTIFDCEVIEALHGSAFDRLPEIVEDLFRDVPVGWPKVPRFPQFLGGVRKRLEAAAGHYGNPWIRASLEFFDRLANATAQRHD